MNSPLIVFQEQNSFFVKFTLNTLDFFIVMQIHVISFFFKKTKNKLGVTPCKAEQPLQRMELQETEA